MKKPILEKTFQARVSRELKQLKNTWFVKIADRAKSGIPDILACIAGNFVALELKRSDKHKATPLQVYTLEQIAGAEGLSFVACPENWKMIYTTLEKLAGGKKGDKLGPEHC